MNNIAHCVNYKNISDLEGKKYYISYQYTSSSNNGYGIIYSNLRKTHDNIEIVTQYIKEQIKEKYNIEASSIIFLSMIELEDE